MSTVEEGSDHLFASTLSELDELISRLGPLKNKDIEYFLDLWRWFFIERTDLPVLKTESSAEEDGGAGDSGLAQMQDQSLPHVVHVQDGWKVLDYEDGLVTSAGENYGACITGPLLKTVAYMVECLQKRGAKEVAFAGSRPAKRAAWMECTRQGIKTRFIPDGQDIKRQDRLKKFLLHRLQLK